MLKLDLHTHSNRSHDGGINLKGYKHALDNYLDYIAITDHNEIDFALEAYKELGERIIVGEEIMTSSGEIIGLFLSSKVKAGQSLQSTIDQIKSQNGIVYVPHPFETVRKGISSYELEKFIAKIDIIEAINGRAVFGKKTNEVTRFANKHNIAKASSSDSHGLVGWGLTYTLINNPPTRENLVNEIRSGELIYKKPLLRATIYPKYNKIKRILS